MEMMWFRLFWHASCRPARSCVPGSVELDAWCRYLNTSSSNDHGASHILEFHRICTDACNHVAFWADLCFLFLCWYSLICVSTCGFGYNVTWPLSSRSPLQLGLKNKQKETWLQRCHYLLAPANLTMHIRILKRCTLSITWPYGARHARTYDSSLYQ